MPAPLAGRLDRRSFFRSGVAGGAVAIGAVLVPRGHFVPAAGAQRDAEEDLAAFAESIELVAVAAYEAGVELLSEDLAPVLQTFRGHHEEHASAYAAVAGAAATGQPNATLLELLTPAIEGFSTQNEVLRFAKDLENQLSVTCGHLLTVLEGSEVVATTAAILPVETSHAAELSYELDEGLDGWFPFGAFESVDLALGLDPVALPVA